MPISAVLKFLLGLIGWSLFSFFQFNQAALLGFEESIDFPDEQREVFWILLLRGQSTEFFPVFLVSLHKHHGGSIDVALAVKPLVGFYPNTIAFVSRCVSVTNAGTRLWRNKAFIVISPGADRRACLFCFLRWLALRGVLRLKEPVHFADELDEALGIVVFRGQLAKLLPALLLFTLHGCPSWVGVVGRLPEVTLSCLSARGQMMVRWSRTREILSRRIACLENHRSLG